MPDLNDAIAKASAEASKEYSETAVEPEAKAEPAVEPKTEAEPKTAEKPAADPATDPKAETPKDENPLNLTSEDLEAIDKDPLLRKAYKTVLRGFTAKTTELAREKRQHEEDMKVIQWFRADPDNALRVIARERGFDIGPPKTEASKAVDEVEDLMLKTFGPDGTKTLRPVFETIVDKIVSSRIAPAQKEVEALKERALETGIENVVQTFVAELTSAEEEYNEEIQNEMAVLAQRVRKADDVPLKDHLRTLYDSVMHRRAQKASVSENLRRLKEARKKSEPVTGTRPAGDAPRKITSDMSLNEKIALAVEMAQRGE